MWFLLSLIRAIFSWKNGQDFLYRSFFVTVLGPVARGLVSANRWLRGIKTAYRFPWYLTLVSANHASNNPGLMYSKVLHALCVKRSCGSGINASSWKNEWILEFDTSERRLGETLRNKHARIHVRSGTGRHNNVQFCAWKVSFRRSFLPSIWLQTKGCLIYAT